MPHFSMRIRLPSSDQSLRGDVCGPEHLCFIVNMEAKSPGIEVSRSQEGADGACLRCEAGKREGRDRKIAVSALSLAIVSTRVRLESQERVSRFMQETSQHPCHSLFVRRGLSGARYEEMRDGADIYAATPDKRSFHAASAARLPLMNLS